MDEMNSNTTVNWNIHLLHIELSDTLVYVIRGVRIDPNQVLVHKYTKVVMIY